MRLMRRRAPARARPRRWPTRSASARPRVTAPSSRHRSTASGPAGLVDRHRSAPDPAPVAAAPPAAAARRRCRTPRSRPTPRSHTRMVTSSGTGPERDELDVDARPGRSPFERRAELAHVDGGRVGDRGPPGGGCPCRPCSRRGRRCTATGLADRPRPSAHVDAGPDRPGPLGRSRPSTSGGPGRGQRRRTARRPATSPASSAAWARQRMPLPLISARLPSALHSSNDQRRPARRAGARAAVRRGSAPSAPDAPAAVAHARGPARPSTGASTVPSSSRTRKSLPRPWCLASVQDGHGWLQSPSRAGSTASGFSAAPNQVMRGSRRHHTRWRRAKRRVRPHGLRPAPRPAAPRSSQVGQHLAVAEGLAGGAGQARRAGRQASAPRRPARPPPGRQPLPRCGGRRSARGSHSPTRRMVGGREGAEPRPEAGERAAAAERHLQGPDHPAAVGRLDPAGGHRVERRPGGGAGRRSSARPRARPAPRDTGRAGSSRSTTALQVQAGPADQQGPMAAPVDVGQRPAGRRPRSGRRLNSSPGSTRSIRWWGISACSAGRRLGRADVHAPVHLHGVDRDQLDGWPAVR